MVQVLRRHRVDTTMPDYRNLQKLSEWWSTVRRRRPYYKEHASKTCLDAIRTSDPNGGGVSVEDALMNLSGGRCCDNVRDWMVDSHLAYNCLILLTAAEMVDRSEGMQK